MERFYKVVARGDAFARPFNLRLQGSEEQKSTVGGLISIVLFGFVLSQLFTLV